ncbi:hypothetical protein SAMN05192551_1172 [Tindallia magadiensis]|uniref:Uncharacterized protein n=1 Tax=Tindallia magadiensis TaxID=69895 RepID=A0A1I3HV25_9FIRM|nr:hypothetical protein SAMN05192551_1172 [Tindallia magadiensis]
MPDTLESIGFNAFGGNQNIILRGSVGSLAEIYAQESNISFSLDTADSEQESEDSEDSQDEPEDTEDEEQEAEDSEIGLFITFS